MMTTRYIDAIQAYRSGRMSAIEATWLSKRIPWKVFVTLNTLAGGMSVEGVKDVVTVMLKMVSYRYRRIMSAAVSYENFAYSQEVHAHLAVGSQAPITVAWFESYLSRFQEIRHRVLQYSDPAILSYVLKTTTTELINCEPYLKEAVTSQERRRLRRMGLK